jgi:hypothetical protein
MKLLPPQELGSGQLPLLILEQDALRKCMSLWVRTVEDARIFQVQLFFL